MRIILIVVTIIFALLGVILGIIYLVNGVIALGLVLLLLIPFLCWLMWISSYLFLTYLCDIKLIRNKLYSVDNDNLKVFLDDEGNSYILSRQRDSTDKNTTEQLIKLKSLLDSGAITQEEFNREKEKLLK